MLYVGILKGFMTDPHSLSLLKVTEGVNIDLKIVYKNM